MEERSRTLPNHYTWLVPVDTRPGQCLHVHIKRSQGDSLNVVASDYECLHGHRASELFADMVSQAETPRRIDIEEPPGCNIMGALEFMHADSPDLDLSKCTALQYAYTASHLRIKKLGDRVLHCASEVIREISSASVQPFEQDAKTPCRSPDVAATNSSMPMTPWDAIAILTLLGDEEEVIQKVNLQQWYSRFPKLFEHPTLFSSCHFFGAPKFASIIKMMNDSNEEERKAISSRSSERVLSATARASSLGCDLLAVLRTFIGRTVATKQHFTAAGGSQAQPLQPSVGTIVSSCIEKDASYVVIEWHSTGKKSTLSLRDFLESGLFKWRERVSTSFNSKESSKLLKSKGAMKYT